MKFYSKSLPVGNLPYDNIKLCKRMMLRLYEHMPFLAELPNMDSNDNIIARTISNIPGINLKNNKIILDEINTKGFMKAISELENAFNSSNSEDLASFSSDSPYFSLYKEMIERIKPKNTVIRLLGPFSLADKISNIDTALLLSDKSYRKYLVQSIAVKAMWFINEIKQANPETQPLILFEEQSLNKFGKLKRLNEEITKENIESIFFKLFSKIKKYGALIGVQSFEKCNWQLVLDSNVDLISFDAYNNSNSLNIIGPKINDFLARGGYINWAMVPTLSENQVKTLNTEVLLSKFKTAAETLANNGVSLDAIYRNATVSVIGNMANLPIIFAEKALIMENQISKKIPESSRVL